MKAVDIHNGLDKSKIRDFLSMAIVKNYESDFENKTKFALEFPARSKDIDDLSYLIKVFDWEIKNEDAKIAFSQKKIELINEKKSIFVLIRTCDWKEFDISDYTENHAGFRLRPSFIGTDEEYAQFLSKIKNGQKGIN